DCDDDGWSDLNILGRASCVPVQAHLVFGGAGLVFSVIGLCHAAYHFNRQVMFHRQQPKAFVSPAEKCRKELHTSTLFADTLSVFYFAAVLG
ncbi:unnamed protein product, partial [Pylaiella littoralis]